ncbi:MAG: agglutinin biogenesis protein MshP [Pseudomonadota bacterium]|nr:agglutinin biogenesis protein MshP [Pseudomonadota bacterium]
MKLSRKKQAGVGLVTAIFLLVVIAGLAAAMVTVFTNQQASSQLDLQGSRAYQSARAGIEWGLFNATQATTYCVPSGTTDATTTNSFALPAASMLSGFTVTVICSTALGPGRDAATMVRKISATSCNQPTNGACGSNSGSNSGNNLDYVQRVIEVQL